MKFTKQDKGKANLSIIFDTPTSVADVARVMSYGAEKYDRKNWSKVDDTERYISATLRHLSQYLSGEVVDDESKLPHLAHAITSLMFVHEIDSLADAESKNNH